MSRASRYRKAAARAAAAQAEQFGSPAAQGSADAIYVGFGNNGHQAADFSRLMGFGYFPELDTRREITSYTRTEIMRRVRFLLANNGFPRRVIYGLSRLAAGTGLVPHALTGDRDWNKEADRYAASRFESPVVFDMGNRYDLYSSQPFVLSASYRDGDQPTILSESKTQQARFAFYQGHQVVNPAELAGDEVDSWFDGVKVDANNAPISYGIRDSDGNVTEVDASNVCFLAEYERSDQTRCTSILEHAVKKMFSANQILSYIQTGVMLTNRFGYWFEYPNPTGSGSGSATQRVSGPTKVINTPAGPITLEQVIGGGAIPDLPPGAQLKTNASSHPHPNNLGLLDYLNRDISWGAGVSPDLLWNIAMLGGANTRFVLADAQSWIEKEQQKLIRQYLQRVWIYTIAKGMKTGALRRCPDPEWWKVGFIPPPRLTVDFGRDGRLYIEQNRSFMLTLKTAYGWQGQEWEEQIDQVLDEIAYIKAGLNADNTKAYVPGKNRNLTWDDVQHYRSSMGNRYNNSSTDSVAADGLPTNPSDASAALAELAKDPARAQALMQRLAALPVAA